jgi:hypothetical protein
MYGFFGKLAIATLARRIDGFIQDLVGKHICSSEVACTETKAYRDVKYNFVARLTFDAAQADFWA